MDKYFFTLWRRATDKTDKTDILIILDKKVDGIYYVNIYYKEFSQFTLDIRYTKDMKKESWLQVNDIISEEKQNIFKAIFKAIFKGEEI